MAIEVSFLSAMFTAAAKEINIKEMKTSPGPITAMAVHRPCCCRHLQELGKDVPYTMKSFALDLCNSNDFQAF
jgi:hypothetical protein